MLGNQLLVYRSHELHACYPCRGATLCSVCLCRVQHMQNNPPSQNCTKTPWYFVVCTILPWRKQKMRRRSLNACAEKVFSAHSQNAGIAFSVLSSENFRTRSCSTDVMSSARVVQVLPVKWQEEPIKCLKWLHQKSVCSPEIWSLD